MLFRSMLATVGPDATPAATIRTPDQRVRVFVSSTLQELAEERGAVRDAVKALRLVPVMFELGARSHPPRQVYRAYLAQSQVFVGVYWQSYGWVAPGEEMSGLEDEYRLSAGMPRLIYVKSGAPGREPRLAQMLARIKDDDSVSYQRFSDSAELQRLVENDLAVLLSERFEMTRPAGRAVDAAPGGALPVPPTPLVPASPRAAPGARAPWAPGARGRPWAPERARRPPSGLVSSTGRPRPARRCRPSGQRSSRRHARRPVSARRRRSRPLGLPRPFGY